MATGGHAQHQSIAGSTSRLGLGATLVAISGIGLVGYGIMFLIRNFTGFIELGLTPGHVGGTPAETAPSARTSTSTSATCRSPYPGFSSRSVSR